MFLTITWNQAFQLRSIAGMQKTRPLLRSMVPLGYGLN
jgi:hypothetical protein